MSAGRIWHVAAALCNASGARSEKWVLRSSLDGWPVATTSDIQGEIATKKKKKKKYIEVVTYGSPTRFLLPARNRRTNLRGKGEGGYVGGLVGEAGSRTGAMAELGNWESWGGVSGERTVGGAAAARCVCLSSWLGFHRFAAKLNLNQLPHGPASLDTPVLQ